MLGLCSTGTLARKDRHWPHRTSLGPALLRKVLFLSKSRTESSGAYLRWFGDDRVADSQQGEELPDHGRGFVPRREVVQEAGVMEPVRLQSCVRVRACGYSLSEARGVVSGYTPFYGEKPMSSIETQKFVCSSNMEMLCDNGPRC